MFLNFLSKYVKLTSWYWQAPPSFVVHSNFQEIDVVIPLIEKDIESFKLCIKALKRHSLNPIRNIYVVSPPSEKILNLTNENDLIFVFEDIIAKYSSEDISETIASRK